MGCSLLRHPRLRSTTLYSGWESNPDTAQRRVRYPKGTTPELKGSLVSPTVCFVSETSKPLVGSDSFPQSKFPDQCYQPIPNELVVSSVVLNITVTGPCFPLSLLVIPPGCSVGAGSGSHESGSTFTMSIRPPHGPGSFPRLCPQHGHGHGQTRTE